MPHQHLQNKQIILASGSPRRKELLSNLGFSFRVQTKPVDEVFPEHLKREEIPLFLSKLKSEAFKKDLDANALIITADTIVWANNKQLGKPKNEPEAKETLKTLSAKAHEVITGVNLLSQDKEHSFYETTTVHFKALSQEVIDYYVSHYKPFDKAGSYGIQEWIGMVGIEKIEGDYYNVMGLPVSKLWDELKQF